MTDWLVSLKQWGEHLTANGYSPRTIASYRYQILRFVGEALIPPNDVNEQHVTAWVATIPGNGAGRNTAARALKSYFSWAAGGDLIDEDPTARIKVKSKKYGAAHALTEEELEALIAAASSNDPRRGLAIRLCYLTGARVDSFCSIKPEDVDLVGARVHLKQTKGDKPYTVPLSARGMDVARELLQLQPAGAWTLVGIKPRTFWMWVHDAAEIAGVKASPHTLRHSFGTHLMLKHGRPRVVQKLMNHASLETTMRYQDVQDPDMAEEVDLLG